MSVQKSETIITGGENTCENTLVSVQLVRYGATVSRSLHRLTAPACGVVVDVIEELAIDELAYEAPSWRPLEGRAARSKRVVMIGGRGDWPGAR